MDTVVHAEIEFDVARKLRLVKRSESTLTVLLNRLSVLNVAGDSGRVARMQKTGPARYDLTVEQCARHATGTENDMDEELYSVADLLLHQSSKDVKYRSVEHEEYEHFLNALRVVREYEDTVRNDVYRHIDSEISGQQTDGLYDCVTPFYVTSVNSNHFAYRALERLVSEARQRYDHMLDEIREDPDIKIINIF